jgi:hypothetical protein
VEARIEPQGAATARHGVRTTLQIQNAVLEGFVIEQVLGALALAGVDARPFFWRTHGGAEEYPMGRGVHAVPARFVASPDRLCQALRLSRKRPARA